MKRFLSMLATLVLVGQSVVTPLVYATDFVNENEETAPVASVETEVADPVSDESDDNEVATDVDNPLDDAEESAELEESAVAEEAVEVDSPETSEEPEIAEEDETSEVVETEKVEETLAEETSAEDVEESSIEEPVSYGKSFSSTLSQSWREISTNGLMVTAIDSLGAFPEGTEMVVTAIEEDEVFDLVNDAIEANVTKVRAVDITFWHNGEAVEPTQPINVTISALNMSEPQTVVHIDDEENVEEMEADIKGKTADFLAESFSIYAIVTYPILTVNFNKGEEVLKTEYVKAIDDVEKLIFDPGVGNLGTNEVFRGWTTESGYGTGSVGMTIDEVRESIKIILNSLESNDDVDFYAMIFNNYTITYLDENGTVIHTDELFFKGNTAPEYTVNAAYTPKTQDQDFEGWKVVEKNEEGNYTSTSTKYQNGEITLPLTGDLILMADAPRGYWLSFDENGTGASYTTSKFIKIGEKTVRPESDPTRFGYTFDDWYTGTGDDAEKFVFGKMLSDHTILYAKWNAQTTANYTVLIWTQNIEGTDYNFKESLTLNGTVGDDVSSIEKVGIGNDAYITVEGEPKKYTGFHLKDYTQDVKINTEGTAVVNVYYDRNEYTLSFQAPKKVNNPSNNDQNLYGYVDDIGYVKLTRNYDWYFQYDNDWYRYNRYGNGSYYHFETIETISKLFEQDISDSFPIQGYDGYVWEPQNSNVFTGGDVPSLNIMPAEATIFHAKKYGDGRDIYMYYYVETVDNQGEIEYAGKHFDEHHHVKISSKGDITSTKTEDFYDIDGFEQYSSVPAYSDGKVELNDSNDYTIKFYYTRKQYTVHFADGVYVDGNNKPVEVPHQNLESNDYSAVYGENIAALNNIKLSNHLGYVFEGWFMDDACTQAYEFTSMPKHNITVYAKWRQIQYRVFLHPNAGTDESLSWGLADKQQTSFRVSNGEKVDKIDGTRTDYELVGWYKDEACKVPYNFSEALNDDTVTTSYDKSKPTELDKWGNLSGENVNKDVPRFRITRELDLYAKWRQILIGAEGINIEYDAGEGINPPKDTTLYSDQSWAIAGAASTPSDENKKFVHWVVQKWNKSTSGFENTDTVVYPGQEFEVLGEYAKVVENEDSTEDKPSFTYIVRLAAVYGDIDNQPTTIKYFSGSTLIDTWEGDVNEPLEIRAGIEKEGYEFVEWNTKADGTGTGFEAGTGVTADNKDLSDGVNKLYAQWTPHTYVVTFNSNGGEGSMDDQSFTYDVEQALRDNAFTKNGYEFDGWNSGKISYTDGQSVKNLTAENGGVVELEAQWKLVDYAITYELNGGTNAQNNPESYTIEDEITLSDPTRDHSNFLGWEPEGSIAKGTTGDKKFTATWECVEGYTGDECKTKISYTITWNNDDGTKKDETTINYGIVPEHDAIEKVNPVTGHIYKWNGWTPTPVAATEDTGYTATFTDACDTDYHPLSDETLSDGTAGEAGSDLTNGSNDVITVNADAGTPGLVCKPNTEVRECLIGEVRNADYIVTGVNVSWNANEKVWEETPICDFTCPNGTELNANKDACERKPGGGGGGGGSAHYSCKGEVPANAVANNDKEPSNSSTSYSYSTDKDGACTFQCKSGYTRKDGKCEESGGNNGGDDDEEIELGGQVSDKCSVEGTNRSEEEIAAYLYACENDITTIRDINKARLGDFLTRAEMAKMVSVFATKELGMKPNTSKDCSNFANSISTYNQEMKDYMVMSCQLELMGIHTVNYEPIPDFMPSKRVSRAEFGTVLSRVLWGNKYEGTNSNYYVNHLNALKENNIITNINPHITEYRAWVFLMLYRAVEAIKVLKSTNNVAIDQQVNEELQEEGKAETGLVVEYDSGSVVPDMATLTESGTLATGAVAKVESGNVAESQTGVTTLTGEDASKEVSAETGAVAETGSTND